MNCIIYIRRKADGVVRTIRAVWDDHLWVEGENSCDCKRAEFFAKIANEPIPRRPCGDSAYAIRAVLDGGLIAHEDDL